MTAGGALQTLSPAKISENYFFLSLKFLQMVVGHTANEKKTSTQKNLKYDKTKNNNNNKKKPQNL